VGDLCRESRVSIQGGAVVKLGDSRDARELTLPAAMEAEGMGDAKASSSGGQRRRVLSVSAGASHTVALLCKPNNTIHSLIHTHKPSFSLIFSAVAIELSRIVSKLGMTTFPQAEAPRCKLNCCHKYMLWMSIK
jgi:hypothetical protein